MHKHSKKADISPLPLQQYEVTNTEFDIKYSDRLLLTSSGEELQFHMSTDFEWSRMAISHFY